MHYCYWYIESNQSQYTLQVMQYRTTLSNVYILRNRSLVQVHCLCIHGCLAQWAMRTCTVNSHYLYSINRVCTLSITACLCPGNREWIEQISEYQPVQVEQREQ